MKSPRIRIQLAVLAFILLPAVAGIVAVNASATCERFVRTYITKPVRNHVSKTTAEAWAAWRVGHPNWKQNPALHRPRYIMNREEAVQKVDFACSVPLLPTSSDALLEASDVPPVVNFLPMEGTQISFPDEVPPEVAELTPQDEWPPLAPYLPPIYGSGGPPGGGVPLFPLVPPVNVPVSGDVPEPSSVLLLASGMGMMALLLAARMRTGKQTAL
jgi:hypothetical protein